MGGPSYLSDQVVRDSITPTKARELIRDALRGDFDPAMDPVRGNVAAGAGHFLLMPSTIGPWTGIKVLTVAPDNPSLGLERIQAFYQLFDSATLTCRAIIEANALTSLRTPATSAVAADVLAAPDASRLLVVGSGGQAIGHVRAMAEIRQLTDIALTARNRDKVAEVVAQLRAEGYPARVADSAAEAADCDIIVCATSAAEPVIADSDVKDGACVIAMGSHEPHYRELPGELMGRSLVIVEDVATALREAGDVIQAIAEGHLKQADLVPLRDLAAGQVSRRTNAPNVFKGVGMSWQDLAVAVGVATAAGIDHT